MCHFRDPLNDITPEIITEFSRNGTEGESDVDDDISNIDYLNPSRHDDMRYSILLNAHEVYFLLCHVCY